MTTFHFRRFEKWIKNNFSVFWSFQYQKYAGFCEEFPSFYSLAETDVLAYTEIVQLICTAYGSVDINQLYKTQPQNFDSNKQLKQNPAYSKEVMEWDDMIMKNMKRMAEDEEYHLEIAKMLS